jgi:putative ABC transport system permease protein
VGAGLVFALTLVLTGISSGFRHESTNTVNVIGADAWVVPKGQRGPFTAQTSVPASVTAKVAREPGVRQAGTLVRVGETARLQNGHSALINLLGHSVGAVGPPSWGAGAVQPRAGEVVVDKRLGAGAGDTVTIAAQRFRVRDVVQDQTFFAGIPVVWMGLADAQRVAYQGRPLASAVLTRGIPRKLPAGYSILAPSAVSHDLLEPLRGAISAIDSLRVLMWMVAAVIIGAVVYLSALERVRDFAVLKAVGGSSRDLMLSLTAEAVVASFAAAALGALAAQLLKPIFPLPVVIETSAYFALPLVAVVVGSIASIAALRRAVSVDPALAFAA